LSDNHWRCQKQIKIPQSNKKIKKDFIRHNSVIAEVTRSNCRNDFYLIMLLIKNGLSPSWPHCFLRDKVERKLYRYLAWNNMHFYLSLFKQFYHGYFVTVTTISLWILCGFVCHKFEFSSQIAHCQQTRLVRVTYVWTAKLRIIFFSFLDFLVTISWTSLFSLNFWTTLHFSF